MRTANAHNGRSFKQHAKTLYTAILPKNFCPAIRELAIPKER